MDFNTMPSLKKSEAKVSLLNPYLGAKWDDLFPQFWAPSNCLLLRPARDFGCSAVGNMEQKKSESSCGARVKAAVCVHMKRNSLDVVKQEQQSVFPEWLSQSQ